MTWVHEKLAVEGKRLRKKGSDDDRVWSVADAYRRLPRSEKWVTDRRMAHARWRQATDV
ncbi:hypothetical protein N9917_00540 [Deltaproteobacteria bacterium]|nr:hypothetical protein [Deltaproteobacteria bacterium]